jgi:hypothetical protein
MRVLVLDGGGSKGFFTLEVLRHLELSCQRPIRECFDLIVGTSIGGFIATCLVAGKSIDAIEAEFLPMIDVFSQIARPSLRAVTSRLLWGHVLDASNWATHMQEFLGDVRVSDLPDSPRLMLVASDASSVVPHPYLIRRLPLGRPLRPRQTSGWSMRFEASPQLRPSTPLTCTAPLRLWTGALSATTLFSLPWQRSIFLEQPLTVWCPLEPEWRHGLRVEAQPVALRDGRGL